MVFVTNGYFQCTDTKQNCQEGIRSSHKTNYGQFHEGKNIGKLTNDRIV